MKLTDSKIKALKPRKKRYIVWDDGTGLGLRIEPSGRKTFFTFYRFDGKGINQTIGTYPAIGLASARKENALIKEKLDKGIDPSKEAKAKIYADRNAYTVANLAEEYLEKWAKKRKKTWQEDERCLNKEIIPAIGKKKAKDVRRRDIILILDRIVERGSPQMANRTMNVITKLFSFAVERDIISGSPCVSLSMPAKKIQRDRVLNESEIKRFWNEMDESEMTKPIQLALKLILATAQRRGEVVAGEWSEFNLDEKWWTIPASKSKNELSHRVPLTEVTISILSEVKELSGNSKYLFPSPRTGTHIDPRAVTRSLKRSQEYFGFDHFTAHDLRRTAATQMASIGINRLTIKKVLNHVDEGVTAIYDRHSYDQEKRQALEIWARKLEAIITGEKGKIVELIKI